MWPCSSSSRSSSTRRAASGGVVAVDGELVAPGVDRGPLERVLDQPQVLVERTDEAGHQMVGDGDGDGRGHGLLGSQATAWRGTSVGPACRTCQPGRPAHLVTAEHVQVEMGDAVEGVLARR